MSAPHRALAALALAALASGCLAVAAGGMGVLVSQEFTSNAHVVQYDLPADQVWPQVVETMSALSVAPPLVDESARTVEAQVPEGTATVLVEATAARRCRMLVGGRRFGMHNSGLAANVMVQLDAAIRR